MGAAMATPARNLYGSSDSSLKRYGRAVALIVVVLVICIWGGRALSALLRDMTPDELREKMAEAAQEGKADDALAVLPLDRAIEQINRMPPDQRREVMRSDAARDYVNRLRPKERSRLVKETLDRGIRDQIERYKKMNKEERKAFVEKAKKRQEEARKKMDELPPDKKEQVRKMATSKDVGEMMEQASKAYLSLTSSDERAELQPLYDGALDNLQHAQELK